MALMDSLLSTHVEVKNRMFTDLLDIRQVPNDQTVSCFYRCRSVETKSDLPNLLD